MAEKFPEGGASENTLQQDAMAAFQRAARRAHQIAHQKGTGVVVMRDGQVVEIPPDPALCKEAATERD